MNSCKSFLNPNYNVFLKLSQLFHNQVQITPAYLNSLINKSFNYKHATQIHSKIITNNFISLSFIFNNLLNLYAKSGHFNKSLTLFKNTQDEYKDVITFTSVITHLSKCNDCYKGLIFFKKMMSCCVLPNEYTFSAVLPICGEIGVVCNGEQVHCLILKHGFVLDLFVGSALVYMYGKCGDMRLAMKVFDEMPERDLVSWNSMINGFLGNKMYGDAVGVFKEVVGVKCVGMNEVAFSSVLSACGNLGGLDIGRQVHGLVLKYGLVSLGYVKNSVMDMYVKCGFLEDAYKLFRTIEDRDVAMWNVIAMGCVQKGNFGEACKFFWDMRCEGISPDEASFSTVLHAAASIAALEQGSMVHNQVIKTGFGCNLCTVNSLIKMYAKCGCLDDAHRVFDECEGKNVVTWTTMISAFQQHGCANQALELFKNTQDEYKNVITFTSVITHLSKCNECYKGLIFFKKMMSCCVLPNEYTFSAVLPICGGIGVVCNGEQVHCLILKHGFVLDLFVGNALVGMYGKCGDMRLAMKVFDEMPERNLVSWNSMINGFLWNKMYGDAVGVFKEVVGVKCVGMNEVAFSSVLSACGNLGGLDIGRQVHGFVLKYGLVSLGYVKNSVMDMYVKCGFLEDANKLFRTIEDRDVGMWNVIAMGCVQKGNFGEACKFFWDMRCEGISPDEASFSTVLHAAASIAALEQGSLVHNQVIKTGFGCNLCIVNSLIKMYAKCGCLADAHRVFDECEGKNVVTWTTMISAFQQHGCAYQALELFKNTQDEYKNVITSHLSKCNECYKGLIFFKKMMSCCVLPNEYTFSAVLPICGGIGVVCNGEQVHCLILKHGFVLDLFVGNALVGMYGKCGDMRLAMKVFDEMPERNLVSWNSMINGFLWNKMYGDAVGVFKEVVGVKCVGMNEVAFSSVLSACGNLGGLDIGRQVHGFVLKYGLVSLGYVKNSVMDMYVKCGFLEDANKLFRTIEDRDVGMWNVIAMGCVQKGNFGEACKFFWDMRCEGISPDEASFSTVLHAAASIAALEQGSMVHNQVIKTGFGCNLRTVNSLIKMYAKCGCLADAHRVFDECEGKNEVTWTTMISAFQQHGCAYEAIELFKNMLDEGIKPCYFTFVSVLSACSHTGRVDEGFYYFNAMSEQHNVNPGLEHYGCMVDLLSRAGRLGEAKNFAQSMPIEPVAAVWGALLGACNRFGNLEMGVEVAKRLFEIEPDNPVNYVLLSNIYTRNGRVKEASEVRRLMAVKRVNKKTGYSWIYFKNK